MKKIGLPWVGLVLTFGLGSVKMRNWIAEWTLESSYRVCALLF
jgi:hypothetical protein